MLPFVILGAVNAYIFLNTGNKKVQEQVEQPVKNRPDSQLKNKKVGGPFTVRHGVDGPLNS